jgi:leucyl aminopeptidase
MIKLTTAAIDRLKVDLLAIPVCEDIDIHDNPVRIKLISTCTNLEEFSGKAKQKILRYNPPGTTAQRCLFLGLGPGNKTSLETLRAFAGRAVKTALETRQKKIAIMIPTSEKIGMAKDGLLQAIAEGAFLANHIFDKYKEKSKVIPLKEICLLLPSKSTKGQRAIIKRVEIICQATLQAREWISTPSNDKVPEQFAKTVSGATEKCDLKTVVLNPAQLKKKKFGALLAVSSGSLHGPRLVEMAYTPKSAKKTIVLVGKGVTFDSGGINLKSSSGLNTMKIDMSGAAVVAATMIAISRLKPDHRVVGIMPLVENMLSGSATRPGDIIRSLDGKTVEIGNTDAEGRLILADAMAYAIKKYKPDTLIDLATLTGACLVALGDKIAGVFSKDETLSDAIIASGDATHERCWPLPLPEDYKDLLKSDLADISNMPSSRYGGAITAALFLSEFVGDTRWAHIDIAGPVFQKKGSDYCGPGGTGFGVRLLCDLIDRLY